MTDSRSKHLDLMMKEALAIEVESAKEAGALGFVARALVQATIPHRSTTEKTFTRENGNYVFSITNPSGKLPYGNVPRLLLAWLATEAVSTRSRKIELGGSLSEFMGKLGLAPTGGRWGSIPRVKEQSKRLFSSFIQCTYTGLDASGANVEAVQNMMIADSAELWWEPANIKQTGLFTSTVVLSERFYDEIILNPVPIDLRALRALKRSPMALDIYCWLTYRMSYLIKPTQIPWEALQGQFGAGYPTTGQGNRDFKKKFLHQLKHVQVVYPDVRVSEGKGGLLIAPSKPHVAKVYTLKSDD
ncbi:MAG: replication protein RepA [Parahaliea sp.]